MLLGIAPSVGAVVSTTETLNVVEEWFPEASVAVHVTVVFPSAKVLPDAGKQLTVGLGSTVSDAVGAVYDTTAPAGPVASIGPTSACEAIDGAVVSTTETLNVVDA